MMWWPAAWSRTRLPPGRRPTLGYPWVVEPEHDGHAVAHVEVQRAHDEGAVAGRGCDGTRCPLDGDRQHEALVLVHVLADDVDPSRRFQHTWG